MKAPVIKIADWFGGNKAAIVIAFDDWMPGQIDVAVPGFMEYGMPGTFFVTLSNLGMRPNYKHWSILQALVDAGSEIANHTVSHQSLPDLKPDQYMYEIYHAKKVIECSLPGSNVTTFAYPAGECDQAVMQAVMHGHIGAKLFDASITHYERDEWERKFIDKFCYDFAKSEDDYYSLPELGVTESLSLLEVKSIVEKVVAKKGLLPIVFHEVYNEHNRADVNSYGAVSEQYFREILNFIASLRSEVWVCTFKDAILYHRSANNTDIDLSWSSEEDQSCQHFEYRVTPNKDKGKEGYYLSPQKLTGNIEISNDCHCISVMQDQKAIAFIALGNRIQFDFEPVDSILSIKIASKHGVITNASIH